MSSSMYLLILNFCKMPNHTSNHPITTRWNQNLTKQIRRTETWLDRPGKSWSRSSVSGECSDHYWHDSECEFEAKRKRNGWKFYQNQKSEISLVCASALDYFETIHDHIKCLFVTLLKFLYHWPWPDLASLTCLEDWRTCHRKSNAMSVVWIYLLYNVSQVKKWK